MRSVLGIWRWRRNPLRRTSDLVEGWLAVGATLLAVLSGPCVGWLVGDAVHHALHEQVRLERLHRHLLPATAVRHAPGRHDPDPETAADGDHRPRVVARWQAPDGTWRSGVVEAPATVGPRDRFHVWTDDRGRAVPRPMDDSTAATHAVLAGVGAGALTAGGVEAARRLVMWRVLRRRSRAWDREWEQAGQDWGRAGAGS
ncbi:hypothetical protein ACFV3R_22535 [Streptomyces sp. NPDC059740]|uniref:Rv1733c family protein n=1 Tax=Streptomyces sp. NPDC059740 TaxID=3346926 RepID=UPI00366537B4